MKKKKSIYQLQTEALGLVYTPTTYKPYNKNYYRTHHYMRRIIKLPNKCPLCKENKKLVLSFDHTKGEHNYNPKDWKWLCNKCHVNRDRRIGSFPMRFG